MPRLRRRQGLLLPRKVTPPNSTELPSPPAECSAPGAVFLCAAGAGTKRTEAARAEQTKQHGPGPAHPAGLFHSARGSWPGPAQRAKLPPPPAFAAKRPSGDGVLAPGRVFFGESRAGRGARPGRNRPNSMAQGPPIRRAFFTPSGGVLAGAGAAGQTAPAARLCGKTAQRGRRFGPGTPFPRRRRPVFAVTPCPRASYHGEERS